jgi:processive 1,2-diacylglycerol beta-glucosyltransferase
VRVLILSADIGEGHDLPARAIRDGLLARRPGTSVEIVDTLAVSGPVMRAGVRAGAETILGRFTPLFDLQYALAGRWGPTQRLASRVLAALAGRGLEATVRAARPDVVVCTYPLANDALCVLKTRGRIDVPLVSAVTDLAALRFWAHPACDLHLTIHPESDAEIRAIAGRDARVQPVRGLTSAAFDHPVDQRAARVDLGLDPVAPIVVVSGGGWGVGDLGGAARAALAARGDVRVVVLCGRSDEVAAQLRAAFAAEPRVTVMGFTDRMSDVLAAGDVLVHSTAGLTVFEALVRGMRVISYGWGVGHIRLNNRAYRRFGLADVVEDRAHLVAAIRRAIERPRQPDAAYGLRRTAADLVLEAGDGARGAERAPTR